MHIAVHLVTGKVVHSVASDGPVDNEELSELKKLFQKVMNAKPDDGGYINFDTDNGWAVIPKASILYAEIIGRSHD